MKYPVFLTILIFTIFASSISSKDSIEPVLRFGDDHLVNPGKIITSDGEVFVMEPKMYRIVIFSEVGEFKMNLGRAGEGPGEFKMLNIVHIANNMIYCYDPMGRRIHLFSIKDKKYLRFIPLTDTLHGYPPTRMVINPDGTIIMFNNGTLKKHTLIGLYTPEGNLIKRFFDAFPIYRNESESRDYSKRNEQSEIDFFRNAGNIAVSEEKLYYANYIENQVMEMDMDGKLLNRFSLPLPSHEKTLKFIAIPMGPKGTTYHAENKLTYDLRSKNNSIYILCCDNGISYIFRLEKGKLQEVCRMKERLTSFDIMNNKIYCLEDEPENEEKNSEVLVYNLPKN